MQMAFDLVTGIQAITTAAVCINLFVSLRGRADIAELKLWVKDELQKYRSREDCTREMDAHREGIDEARDFFARWRPNVAPPTDKR